MSDTVPPNVQSEQVDETDLIKKILKDMYAPIMTETPSTTATPATVTATTEVEPETSNTPIEAVDTPAPSEDEAHEKEQKQEEEEEEEHEEEEGEEQWPNAPKNRDERLPCEIKCAASLLALVYLFRLFIAACQLMQCGKNGLVIKDL